MKPEIAEYLAVLEAVRKVIKTESKIITEIVLIRIQENSSPELLESNLKNPYNTIMDLMDVEATIEHIFDMGRLDAYKNLYEEFTRTIKNIEYEDKISQ